MVVVMIVVIPGPLLLQEGQLVSMHLLVTKFLVLHVVLHLNLLPLPLSGCLDGRLRSVKKDGAWCVDFI